ncbi:FkbM family methyltransferase [Labrys neptuniae]|uniref:FkbM family methyltransferase n=1 Tax=Labrys neptuniae TaxID=376174 RepID=UPI0028908135|nr:FkbM family methyltransferase [Labrys neptuniae]MDT3378357.1 FkbM family methyltransferase [Labrys neptuniae]
MGVLRAQISRLVKRVLARHGLLLIRTGAKFGHDPWADIRHLAEDWRYPIVTVFDVGANDGETAALALRKFPGARIVSFEPHPDTFAVLMQRLGQEPRFTGVNTALGTQTGTVDMFEYPSSKINSLSDRAQYALRYPQGATQISVRSMTLDAYCQQNGFEAVDILKLDTEGFDRMVLEGGRAMLERRAIKFIYVEFNDLQPKEKAVGGDLISIDTLLRPHGYRFVASYNDYVVAEGEMFCVSNALFALPPAAATPPSKPERF